MTFSQAVDAWLRAQAEAAVLGTPEATARAEEARQALAQHPAARHARRSHNGGVVGSIDGVAD